MIRAYVNGTAHQKIEHYSRREGDCLIWTGHRDGCGYPRLRVKGKKISVTRFLLAEKLGRPIRKGYHACHTCDVPYCIEKKHLRERTPLWNMRDRERKGRGRQPRGSKSGQAKLTEKKVLMIRRKLKQGVTAVDLALRYGVSSVAIDHVNHRRTWGHV